MLTIADITIAITLIALILLQERSSGGAGGLLGGTSADAPYQTRRGIERIAFWATVVLAIAFAGISIAKLVVGV